jgi:hypothetical protein
MRVDSPDSADAKTYFVSTFFGVFFDLFFSLFFSVFFTAFSSVSGIRPFEGFFVRFVGLFDFGSSFLVIVVE